MFHPTLDPAIGGVGPALITPPYPDHPSGATSYASASMQALASFFGSDEVPFYATSSRFPGEQRAFSRFSDVTNEVLEARIYAGIHFRTPDVQSADLGREIGVILAWFAAAPRSLETGERPSAAARDPALAAPDLGKYRLLLGVRYNPPPWPATDLVSK